MVHLYGITQKNAIEINSPKALQIPYDSTIISYCPVGSKNLVMEQHFDGFRETNWSFLNLDDQAPALRDVHFVLKHLE